MTSNTKNHATNQLLFILSGKKKCPYLSPQNPYSNTLVISTQSGFIPFAKKLSIFACQNEPTAFNTLLFPNTNPHISQFRLARITTDQRYMILSKFFLSLKKNIKYAINITPIIKIVCGDNVTDKPKNNQDSK